MPLNDLPRRAFISLGVHSRRTRYFIHKLPIALVGEPPVVHLVYLATDGGTAPFETFLREHARLLSALPAWVVVVAHPIRVSATPVTVSMPKSDAARHDAKYRVRTVNVPAVNEGGATPPSGADRRAGACWRPVGPAGSLPPRWSCHWWVSVRTTLVSTRGAIRGLAMSNRRSLNEHTRMRTLVEDLDSGEDPGHLVDDYRADSAPSRLFATLRPRVRGAHGLDRALSQPGLAFTRWPGRTFNRREHVYE